MRFLNMLRRIRRNRRSLQARVDVSEARVQFLFDQLKETPDGLHAWPHSEVVQEVPGVGNINMETGEPV